MFLWVRDRTRGSKLSEQLDNPIVSRVAAICFIIIITFFFCFSSFWICCNSSWAMRVSHLARSNCSQARCILSLRTGFIDGCPEVRLYFYSRKRSGLFTPSTEVRGFPTTLMFERFFVDRDEVFLLIIYMSGEYMVVDSSCLSSSGRSRGGWLSEVSTLWLFRGGLIG